MMNARGAVASLIIASGMCAGMSNESRAQCGLSEFFSGCFSCCRKAPAPYAVAPIMAQPIMPVPVAPVPVAPVVVPVQQVSYVPETCYRTTYECVPVTCYKPSTEIDPCTGYSQQCMEQVTQYVQKPVVTPYTQYRAVYSTRYVQMQPGATQSPGAVAVPGAAQVPGAVYAPGPVAGSQSPPAASPFASPIQNPQAWGAAGSDVPPQFSPPTGATIAPAQPSPITTQPSLRPIPELPRTSSPSAPSGTRLNADASLTAPPTMSPIQSSPSNPDANATGMPVLPGAGPSSSTQAFPKLLEPTSHTTSWWPSREQSTVVEASWQPVTVNRTYPTAALPTRVQQ